MRSAPIAGNRRCLHYAAVIGLKHALLSLAALIALAACGQSLPDDHVLAEAIERKVLSRRPELHLERYARFYAHGPRASVHGVYVFSNVGLQPIVGRAGETVWTTLDALPVISDGGCGVLILDYDAAADELRSFNCS